jgi:hypothetical protein
MWRAILFGTVASVGLVLAPAGWGQDSGPGPGTVGGDQVYDVTVVKFTNVSTGTFTFTEEPAGEMEEPSTSVITTGTFSATVGEQVSTGTWFAIDLGDFALWTATAEGTTSRISAFGYATPELIAGRLITTSTTATTGRGRLLRALFNSSFFFGTAAEEEIPEPPVTTTNG